MAHGFAAALAQNTCFCRLLERRQVCQTDSYVVRRLSIRSIISGPFHTGCVIRRCVVACDATPNMKFHHDTSDLDIGRPEQGHITMRLQREAAVPAAPSSALSLALCVLAVRPSRARPDAVVAAVRSHMNHKPSEGEQRRGRVWVCRKRPDPWGDRPKLRENRPRSNS